MIRDLRKKMKLVLILPDADHVSILRRQRFTKNWHFSFAFKSQKITETLCESLSHLQIKKLSKTENCLFWFRNLLLSRRADLVKHWMKAGTHSQLVNENKTFVWKWKKQKKKWKVHYETENILWIQWFLKPSEIYKHI